MRLSHTLLLLSMAVLAAHAAPAATTTTAGAASSTSVAPDATKTDSKSSSPSTTSAGGQTSPTGGASATGGSGENLQKFTGAIGGVKAPKVTDTGAEKNDKFQVEGNSKFGNEKSAITRSCDVQNNKCQNAFNAQPNGNPNNAIKAGDCGQQQQACNAQDNSKAQSGGGSATTGGSGGASTTTGGASPTGGAGDNLQKFTGAIGGVKAPKVTDTGAQGNDKFQVEGNSKFGNQQSAITRSCDVQNNKCQNAFNAQPNGNPNNAIKAGDCGTQQQACNAQDNSKAQGGSAGATTTGAGSSSTAGAGSSSTAGAGSSSTAATGSSTTSPSSTGTAAPSGTSTAAATGGKGGVDPASGKTLLPLPEVSKFCKDSKQTKADGTQIEGGVCSSVIQGQIPSFDNMVSSLITEPANGGTVKQKDGFNVTVKVVNLATGFFSDAEKEYNTQPQSLNDKGIIEGHDHITVQFLGDGKKPVEATDKAFFKGLNDKANGAGELSVNVPTVNLTVTGLYRICSMAASFSHQPVIMPVAQRGAQDDCIRIKVE